MTQEEKDLFSSDIWTDRIIGNNSDFNSVSEIPYDTEAVTIKSPRYTKMEIENRLYTIIDNEAIFPLNEDRGAAFKLINKLLESLD